LEGRDFFGEGTSLDALIERADSSNPMERWAAVIGLGEDGSEGAVHTLRAYLDDPDEYVRDAARSALLKFDRAVLLRAGLAAQPDRVPIRIYQPGSIRFATHLEAPRHTVWKIRPLPDIAKDNMWLVDAAIIDIVDTEGPVTGHRLHHLYSRGAWPNEPWKLSSGKLQMAVDRLIRQHLISRSDDMTSDQLAGRILHRTGSQGVVVRQRGTRELRDIPVNEVRQVLLELSRSLDGSLKLDNNRAFQLIFDFYNIEQQEYHVVGKLLAEEWSSLLRTR
jgi:HEAT repeat protein